MERLILENQEAPEQTITTIESGTGEKLVYRQEFKGFIHDHPGYFGFIGKAIDSMVSHDMKSFPLRQIPVDIERTYGGNSPTFKATLRDTGESYFIKADKDRGDAEREIMTMELAKKSLSEFPWIKIPNYQCGYVNADKKGYYVAKWDDTASEPMQYGVNKWAERFGPDKEDGFLEDSRKKLATIQEKLTPLGFSDITEGNVAYDPVTGNMTVFDLMFDEKVSPKEILKADQL